MRFVKGIKSPPLSEDHKRKLRESAMRKINSNKTHMEKKTVEEVIDGIKASPSDFDQVEWDKVCASLPEDEREEATKKVNAALKESEAN